MRKLGKILSQRLKSQVNKKKFNKVLVVLGGTSGERAVSLESGKACVKALKKKGYKVFTFDPNFKNFSLIDQNKIDVIFNALQGTLGEDGKIHGLFEFFQIPYTHSGVSSSAVGMNKLFSKNNGYKLSCRIEDL